MATISGIRGMLLEEAILYLLRVSGYRTLEKIDPADTTITGDCYSGLKVLGRGGIHQIDAIADFMITPPFTYAQRLLIEAKCYSDTYPVGIEIVRNAVGVLKDVGEYWETRKGLPSKARYHYQYALFSASRYTVDAERYAYAHDIYLIPLAKSTYFQPIIKAIRRVTSRSFGVGPRDPIEVKITDLRRGVRAKMRNPEDWQLSEILGSYMQAFPIIDTFCQECRRINAALLAMIAGRFPVFLVPNPTLPINQLQDYYSVRIFWNEKGWYLRSQGTNLFSFDLPPDLFEYYAEQGVLSSTQALNLKEDVFSEIQGIIMVNDRFRVVRFSLDQEWLNSVRNRIRQIRVEER